MSNFIKFISYWIRFCSLKRRLTAKKKTSTDPWTTTKYSDTIRDCLWSSAHRRAVHNRTSLTPRRARYGKKKGHMTSYWNIKISCGGTSSSFETKKWPLRAPPLKFPHPPPPLHKLRTFSINSIQISFRVTNKRRSILSLTKKKAEVPGTSTAAMMLKMHRRLRRFMLVGFSSTFSCRRPKPAAIYSGTKAKNKSPVGRLHNPRGYFGTIQTFCYLKEHLYICICTCL